MKSDWHRYNLKRRVAHLPPISEDVFSSKVQALSSDNVEGASVANKKKQLTKKEIRRREKEVLLEKKKQLLKLAHQNAVESMEQRQGFISPTDGNTSFEEKAGAVEEEDDDEDELTEEKLEEKLILEKLANKVDIPLEECLFCTKRRFKDMECNLEHMFKQHGFYIPEQKFLVDKEGLLKYISEKIGLGNVCIVCNFQGRSLEAVRAHMLAKRHCKIPYEEEDEKLEISEFYNFTSSYKNFEITNHDSKDEDWEDVDSADEDIVDEEQTQDYLYHDGVELHLPSGVKVGHRSLQRYYKQNLKPEVELTEGQGTLIAAETRTFLTPFDRKKVQVQQRVWQTEVKDNKRNDKRAAKFVNNQPHYRDQLLQ